MIFQKKYNFWQIFITCIILKIFLICPISLKAGINDFDFEYSRFSLELWGGYAVLNPTDLNLIVDYDNRIQEFNYDSYLNSLQNTGSILSWTQMMEGERKKINHSIPLGIRVKFDIWEFLAVSFNLEYYQDSRSEDLNFTYTRNETFGEQYIEEVAYSPYLISVRTFLPAVGIHFQPRITRLFKTEAYFTAGPLIAKCRYETNWQYVWRVQGADYGYLVHQSENSLQEEGSGTGIGLEIGVRLSLPLIRRFEVFIEGGYAYQKVSTLTGSGHENLGGNLSFWQGEWQVASETLTAPWGDIALDFPTNLRQAGETQSDFSLDLSGLRLRLGFSFRF